MIQNSYQYDANGNVFSRNGPGVAGGNVQSFEYTPFDLPSVITTGIDNITTFGYSADEERVARRDSNGTIHFVANLYERKLDSVDTTLEERFRFYAGDRQLGEIVRKDGTDQTLYFHTDRLGSPDTISDDTGASFKEQFDPFGAPLDPPNPEITRVGFTGQDHDNDLGLIDMKGRIYDPLAGRFTTADPVMQAPFWSQGLNRYSYVFNNPVNNTDPSGFEANGEDSTLGIMGWGGATVGGAYLSSASFGAIAGGTGIVGLNVGTSLLTNEYSLFDGSVGSASHGVAPSAAPKGTGVARGSGAGAVGQNKAAVGPTGAQVRERPVPQDGAGVRSPSAPSGNEGGRPNWKQILKKVHWQKSEELAAYIFLDAADPPSIKYNREVYTLIVRQSGKFATIPAQLGSANASDGFWEYYEDFVDGAPGDAQVTGWAHTHGIYDAPTSNDFSAADAKVTSRVGTGYLGTPSGRFKVLQPGQTFGTDLGSLPPCRCYDNP